MNRWNQIAARVAQEIKDGELVNLGKGIPSFVAEFIDSKKIVNGKIPDVAVLDAQEVDENGEVVICVSSEKEVKANGIELISSAKKVIVAMEHLSVDGAPKIRRKCTMPVLQKIKADMIITDMAVIKVTKKGLVLKELAPGVNWHQVQEATEAFLILDENIFLGGRVY